MWHGHGWNIKNDGKWLLQVFSSFKLPLCDIHSTHLMMSAFLSGVEYEIIRGGWVAGSHSSIFSILSSQGTEARHFKHHMKQLNY